MDLKEFLKIRKAADDIRQTQPQDIRPSLGSIGALAWLCRWGWPSVRIVALCDVQKCSVGTESYRLGKLCKAGFLTREVSDDDARMLYFSATESGKILFARAFTKAFGHVKGVDKNELMRRIMAFAVACSMETKVAEVTLLSLVELGVPGVSDWGLRKLVDGGLVRRTKPRDLEDIRMFKYELTEEGEALANRLIEAVENLDTPIKIVIPKEYLDISYF